MKEQSTMLKELGFKGFAKYIGKEWKKIGPQERRQYKEMAARDKARYGLEMIAWQNEQAEFLDRLQDSEAEAHQDDEEEDHVDQPPKKEKYQEPRETRQLIPNISLVQGARQGHSLCESTFFGESIKPKAQGVSSKTNSGGVQVNAYPIHALLHQAPLPFYQENGSRVFFDQKRSLASMAREFGNDGIDYLLCVLGPCQDA